MMPPRPQWQQWFVNANHAADRRWFELLAFLKRNRLRIIFGAIYVVLTLHTLLNFINTSRLGDVYYRASFQSMYSGQAWKPFVYRVLVPRRHAP